MRRMRGVLKIGDARTGNAPTTGEWTGRLQGDWMAERYRRYVLVRKNW